MESFLLLCARNHRPWKKTRDHPAIGYFHLTEHWNAHGIVMKEKRQRKSIHVTVKTERFGKENIYGPTKKHSHAGSVQSGKWDAWLATRKSIDANDRWYSCRRSKRKGVVPRPSVRVLGLIRINNADIGDERKGKEMNGQKHIHTPDPTTLRQNENKAKKKWPPCPLCICRTNK